MTVSRSSLVSATTTRAALYRWLVAVLTGLGFAGTGIVDLTL
jgi:hypothetical protein